MALFALIAPGTLGYCQSDSTDKTSVLSPKDFPIPEGARELKVDEHKQEIRFQTETPIDATATFFQAKMKELDWAPTFEQVASIFANLYYKKDGKNIKIRVKKKNIFKPTLSVTILGDGFAWKGGPAAEDAPKRRERAESAEQPVGQHKPEKISTKKLKAAVNGGFDSQESYFLEQDRYLLLRCTSADRPTVSGGAGGLSIGSSDDVAAKIEVAGNRIAGKVGTSKPESSGPSTFSYKTEFDLPITAFD